MVFRYNCRCASLPNRYPHPPPHEYGVSQKYSSPYLWIILDKDPVNRKRYYPSYSPINKKRVYIGTFGLESPTFFKKIRLNSSNIFILGAFKRSISVFYSWKGLFPEKSPFHFLYPSYLCLKDLWQSLSAEMVDKLTFSLRTEAKLLLLLQQDHTTNLLFS